MNNKVSFDNLKSYLPKTNVHTVKRKAMAECAALEAIESKRNRQEIEHDLGSSSLPNSTTLVEKSLLNSFNKSSSQNVDYIDDIQNAGFQVGFHSNCEMNLNEQSFNELSVEDEMSLNSIFKEVHTETLKNDLRAWSLRYNIRNQALSALLKTLKKYNNPDLPADARSLKGTPRRIVSRSVDPGRYWHFGIRKMIEILKLKNVDLPEELTLNVNIDGLPIYNSSKALFWPILGKFVELDFLKPFVIGIYFHDSKKPTDIRSYLKDFITEMKYFSTHKFCGTSVSPGLFILDAPAKSFVKQTRGHNSKKGCGFCEVTGKHIGKRISYVNTENNNKRSDEDFRKRTDPEHHNDCTLPAKSDENETLEDVPGINMIESFPPDSLHVLYLGVTKKELQMIFKKMKYPMNELLRRKLSRTDENKIHLSISSAQMTKPSEFNRALRSIEYLQFFKGTELRTFLLYHGIVVLKNNIDIEIYNHFLTLHVAVLICSSNKFRKYVPATQILFKNFVKKLKVIFGNCMLSYNVHQLLHITEYVLKYGPLDNYSAFDFESKLGELSNFICSGNNPLEQISNRVVEHIELDVENYIEKKLEGNLL